MSSTPVSLLERLKVANPDASDWQRLHEIYLPMIRRWQGTIDDFLAQLEDPASALAREWDAEHDRSSRRDEEIECVESERHARQCLGVVPGHLWCEAAGRDRSGGDVRRLIPGPPGRRLAQPGRGLPLGGPRLAPARRPERRPGLSCRTQRDDCKDFHLRLEARINEGGNSGIHFRTAFGPAQPVASPKYLTGYNVKIDGKRLGGLLIDHPAAGGPLVRSHVPSVVSNRVVCL